MTIDLLSMASIIVIFQSFLMAAFLALNKKIANQQPYARLFTPCICRDSGPHTAHKQSSFLCNNCAAAKNHFRLRAIRLFSRTSIVFLHQDSSLSNFSFQNNGLDSFCSLCLSRIRSNFHRAHDGTFYTMDVSRKKLYERRSCAADNPLQPTAVT